MKNFKAEETVSSNLRTLLGALAQGEKIEESESLQEVLDGLEFVSTAILQDKYHEWKYESLDGFYLVEASKVGDNEAEFFGLCCLISDQTMTPLHLRLRIAESENEIEWLVCRLGQNTQDGVLKIPYHASKKWTGYMSKLDSTSIKAIGWAYEVTIGDEQA